MEANGKRIPWRKRIGKAALRRAIEVVDSQSALARALGINQQNVSYWLHEGKGKVPAEYCTGIERATGGKVTRHDLRPDLFGPNQ
jgi:DNA-binding transcriptional regulator YdaS (Cro superfamily)